MALLKVSLRRREIAGTKRLAGGLHAPANPISGKVEVNASPRHPGTGRDLCHRRARPRARVGRRAVGTGTRAAPASGPPGL